jgi:methionyl-tRNA synthetase
LEENPNVIVPANQYRDVLRHLEENELGDLSISRLKSRVSWGINVPNDDEHVIYVWLDALTNYLTVTGYPEQKNYLTDGSAIGSKNTHQSMPHWPAAWHIVGMDIIKFHAIYWPAFLMAAKMPLPRKILSHGHWLVSNQKMSKSSGNGVDAIELLEKYGTDAIRFFLLRDGGISINPGNLKLDNT